MAVGNLECLWERREGVDIAFPLLPGPDWCPGVLEYHFQGSRDSISSCTPFGLQAHLAMCCMPSPLPRIRVSSPFGEVALTHRKAPLPPP